ncbi:hypothetical protein CLF_104272 [Clonorchis sinensis]|uniref:Uncharacterized protein n=1 Tax=Clonorchis sinensis TaxID=79923 RepID=G7YBA4_CLOSI|nr:hypothetical protein CLF_104272 [Clonorchis sinensis]
MNCVSKVFPATNASVDQECERTCDGVPTRVPSASVKERSCKSGISQTTALLHQYFSPKAHACRTAPEYHFKFVNILRAKTRNNFRATRLSLLLTETYIAKECTTAPANRLLLNYKVPVDSYLHMLQAHVIPQPKQHKKSSTVFQQDGAALHYSNQRITDFNLLWDHRVNALSGFPSTLGLDKYAYFHGNLVPIREIQTNLSFMMVRFNLSSRVSLRPYVPDSFALFRTVWKFDWLYAHSVPDNRLRSLCSSIGPPNFYNLGNKPFRPMLSQSVAYEITQVNRASKSSLYVEPVRVAHRVAAVMKTSDQGGLMTDSLRSDVSDAVWPSTFTKFLIESNRQLNVLQQAASCFSCYDIRDIVIHGRLIGVVVLGLGVIEGFPQELKQLKAPLTDKNTHLHLFVFFLRCWCDGYLSRKSTRKIHTNASSLFVVVSDFIYFDYETCQLYVSVRILSLGWEKELCEADGFLVCGVNDPTSATYKAVVACDVDVQIFSHSIRKVHCLQICIATVRTAKKFGCALETTTKVFEVLQTVSFDALAAPLKRSGISTGRFDQLIIVRVQRIPVSESYNVVVRCGPRQRSFGPLYPAVDWMDVTMSVHELVMNHTNQFLVNLTALVVSRIQWRPCNKIIAINAILCEHVHLSSAHRLGDRPQCVALIPLLFLSLANEVAATGTNALGTRFVSFKTELNNSSARSEDRTQNGVIWQHANNVTLKSPVRYTVHNSRLFDKVLFGGKRS